jgi:hypothetical protein
MLPPEDPRAGLRRLFARLEPAQQPGPPPAELEARLLAQHQRLHPPKAGRGAFVTFLGAHRLAASGAAFALVVGACQLPTEYERSFGVSFACTAPRTAYARDSVPDLADRLGAAIEAVSMSLRVHDDGGPTLAMRIDAWGPVEDHGAALAAIRAAAPALKDAHCEAEPLAGTVHGTLGGRLGYALLDLDIDHKGAELTRTEILEQLHAQGFTGTAEVEVEEDAGQRRVKIRLEQHQSSEAEPQP